MIGVMEDKKIFEQLAYKIAREVAAEKDRRHGVILEDIQGKFNALTEGQNAMEKRMDRFDGRLVKIEVNVEKVGETLNEIREDIRDKADKKDVVALECRATKLEHL
jgi:SMC interacting uncharacterized protein involved in chromosome segregation